MESGKINLEKGQNQEPAPVPVPEPSTSKGSGHSKPSRPRRGRPTGANRTPLSLEERRARNAQYERERREDLAQAQAELAEAAGCDPNVSEADLLAFVVNKLSADKLEKKQSIEEYRRLNAKLEAHIASCILRLGPDYVDSDDDEEVQLEEPNTRKRKSDETIGDEKRLRRSGKQIPASWISPTDLAEAGPSSLSPPVQQDTIEQVLADLDDFSQLETSDNDQLAPPVTESPSQDQYFASEQYLLPPSLPGGSEQQQQQPDQLQQQQQQQEDLLGEILDYLGISSAESQSALERAPNAQSSLLATAETECPPPYQYIPPQQYLLPPPSVPVQQPESDIDLTQIYSPEELERLYNAIDQFI
ncbi:uncharacterized protein LOC118275300 isoform X2 [Spodoptera frugiperda]|uniref:Uncharacterized protein LOC118275300 isoform X2 n=1 Tax=Spodoptera frugiperda TaxID=7108 RepID=A0A9R0DQU9_SPOFR|nr:uncharacterized protein LOC118275300 isoform X2 [Spodoptera frugiperda]XP_050551254.1 uncharacterized protein LOC118275300 isoform X3 [Spodoptera frugiperda]XP_050551255.1 uncharacterized protein LOC118275300 isoform X4 [Spodoptera frugiperda]XP_050551256.1 uncharacterized protein LOC118275300 isoform X2 [Spodoptera frugiperda]